MDHHNSSHVLITANHRNVIRFVNGCYTFRPCGPSSGIKYTILITNMSILIWCTKTGSIPQKSIATVLCLYRALLDKVEIENTMHKFSPLLYSYMLTPTCFVSSLPSSGSFWIRLSRSVYSSNLDGSRRSLKISDYCRNM
jgi:hypothetical protein